MGQKAEQRGGQHGRSPAGPRTPSRRLAPVGQLQHAAELPRLLGHRHQRRYRRLSQPQTALKAALHAAPAGPRGVPHLPGRPHHGRHVLQQTSSASAPGRDAPLPARQSAPRRLTGWKQGAERWQ